MISHVFVFILGIYFFFIITEINKFIINMRITNIYKEILSKLKSGNCKFNYRINNTVYIDINLKEGNSVIYRMDKDDVCVFDNDTCLYLDNKVPKKIKKEIIKTINELYNSEINDCIVILGNKYSRSSLKKIGANLELMEDIFGDSNSIQKEVKYELNIDDILDKISLSGMESLNESEKEFLEKFSKR